MAATSAAADAAADQKENDIKNERKMKQLLKGSKMSSKLTEKAEEAKKKAQLRRLQLIQEGLQSGVPRSSIKPALKSVKLEKYYDYFEKAGFDVMESFLRREDNEVDEMLKTIEQANDIEFPVHHRVQLWKLFRHKWFKSPAAVKKFILGSEVPDIFLPKPYHRQSDSTVELAQLDPDRVRQVTRKEVMGGEYSSDGPGFKIDQFENYSRLGDEVYELRDIQRSVQEWQTLDPQKMLRADPREEVFFVRIKKMEMMIANKMTQQRLSDKKHEALKRSLNILRLACGIMAFIMIFYSFNSNRDMDSQLLLKFTVSNKTFISGVWFFVGSCFAHGIMGHWHQEATLQRLQRMHMLCKKLSAQLVDFRLESADMRLEKFDVPVNEMKDYFGLQTEDIDYDQAEKRAQGKKDFASWMQAANPGGRKIDLSQIAYQLEDTYEQLPDLPPGFDSRGATGGKWAGGDRLAKMRGKIGGVQEFTRSANPNVAAKMMELHYDEKAERDQLKYFEKQKARIQRRLQKQMQGDYSSSEESSDESDETESNEEEGEEEESRRLEAPNERSSSSSSGGMGPGGGQMGPRQAGSMSGDSGHQPQQNGSSSSNGQQNGSSSSSGGAPAESQQAGPASSATGTLPPLPPLPPAPSGLDTPPGMQASPVLHSEGTHQQPVPTRATGQRWAEATPAAQRLPAVPSTGASLPPPDSRPASSESQRAAMAAAAVPPVPVIHYPAGTGPQPATPARPHQVSGQVEHDLPGTPENPPGIGELPPVPPGMTARSQDSATAGSPSRPP